MVKRATIHVSSRTKMNHPKKWRVRIITKDKKGNEKKTTNTTFTIFYNQVTLAGKLVAILSSRSCCFWLFTLQKDCIHAQRVLSSRSCSISWHSFSPWHNLSKLSSTHGLSKELLLVVKVVLVVFLLSRLHRNNTIQRLCPSI